MTRLSVDGGAGTPQQLGFDDLAKLDGQVADVADLVPGRRGGGVRLDAILAAVRADPAATHVTLSSTDGTFSASVPLEAVRDAVVVYRLGGEPLPESLGGPLRFLIPAVDKCAVGGVDACANVKFLGSIRLSRGAGRDTRPTTERAHLDLHEKEESERRR